MVKLGFRLEEVERMTEAEVASYIEIFDETTSGGKTKKYVVRRPSGKGKSRPGSR